MDTLLLKYKVARRVYVWVGAGVRFACVFRLRFGDPSIQDLRFALRFVFRCHMGVCVLSFERSFWMRFADPSHAIFAFCVAFWGATKTVWGLRLDADGPNRTQAGLNTPIWRKRDGGFSLSGLKMCPRLWTRRIG